MDFGITIKPETLQYGINNSSNISNLATARAVHKSKEKFALGFICSIRLLINLIFDKFSFFANNCIKCIFLRLASTIVTDKCGKSNFKIIPGLPLPLPKSKIEFIL